MSKYQEIIFLIDRKKYDIAISKIKIAIANNPQEFT